MQAATEHTALSSTDNQIGSLGAIVADVMSLIGHVQASITLIETAIRRESAPCNHDDDGDVVVLDDVTPCYARATSALSACNMSLEAALRSLLDVSEQVAEPLRQHARVSHKSA